MKGYCIIMLYFLPKIIDKLWGDKMLIVGCLLMLFGLIIIVLGIVLWKKQEATWVSMHANVTEEDIEAFTKMCGQSTIGIGISVFCMGLFFALHLMIIGAILFAICFILSFTVYVIAQTKYNGRKTSQLNQSGAGNKTGNKRNAAFIIVIGLAILAGISVPSILIYRSSLPPVFSVSGGVLKISTDFGETVSLSDIEKVRLENNMPGGLSKTNGLDLGSILRGEFQAGGNEMNVYVDTSKPPFIYIDTANGLVIINDQTKSKTQALYDELNSKIKQ
jgi:hypothetical protein